MVQPSTLAGVVADAQLLGGIFHVSTPASGLASSLDAVLNRTASLRSQWTANATPLPTVLLTYSVDQNGYFTFGPGTFGESLIELAGGRSVSANASTYYPELSGEQVLASDPDYVVYGTGFGLNESFFAQAPFWSQLTATQNGRAVAMNSNYFTEPNPTMILLGLPELVAILHPGSSA
jgi:iron complex transport system substrate-binding protein